MILALCFASRYAQGERVRFPGIPPESASRLYFAVPYEACPDHPAKTRSNKAIVLLRHFCCEEKQKWVLTTWMPFLALRFVPATFRSRLLPVTFQQAPAAMIRNFFKYTNGPYPGSDRPQSRASRVRPTPAVKPATTATATPEPLLLHR